MKRIILFIAFTFIFCSHFYSQSKELKFDMKYQITGNDYMIVNDTINHKMGKAMGSGSAMLSDGSSAIVQVFFIYDYVNGNGDFIEYYKMNFKDSSTLFIQAKGRSFGSTDESMPLFNASVTVIDGTGIYENAKGMGTMTGNRKNILDDGAVVKLSFTISLK